MICSLWGKCGGCSLPLPYKKQLHKKITDFRALNIVGDVSVEIFESPIEGYRSRGEFKIYRDEFGVHLAMFSGKKPIIIKRCAILLPYLQDKLEMLLDFLNQRLDFSTKLYSVEIIGGRDKECLITLIYHRKLDLLWEEMAKKLEEELGAKIIGRSRGQKITLTQDFLLDTLELGGDSYCFMRYDNAFSQPNLYMNTKMLEFALSCVQDNPKDLLELYCGGGNFTIPLSKKFSKVFATEVAKSSIKALKQNLQNNNIDNVFYARLSGEESIQALNFVRDFNRLRGIDLYKYHFTHLLVDPPRSGIGDKKMLEFMGKFQNIIYISCNPLSLKKDLEALNQTHKIRKIAIFDQFPYTHHLECGLWLKKGE